MIRSFRYRLSPTRAQEKILLSWLTRTRELYNAALEERIGAWEKQHKYVSYIDQSNQLADVRRERADFQGIPIVILRGALRRIDHAFADFFRRCKNSQKPGHPRFKSAARWRSLALDQIAAKTPIVAGGKRLAVPLLGKVKIRLHRPLEGAPKTMRIKLDGDGHWYVMLCCMNVPAKPLPPVNRDIGIDLGLHHYAATSDGEIFDNPRHLATARIGLERAQRRVSRRTKRSRRWRTAVTLLKKKYARVHRLRQEQHINMARKLISGYDTLYVEELTIANMTRGSDATNIFDAAWGDFLHWLRIKAESAGREVVGVKPHGTSQTCPQCNKVVEKTLKIRVHSCECGLVIDRDIAAAQVILRLGRSLRRDAVLVKARQRPAQIESVQTGDN